MDAISRSVTPARTALGLTTRLSSVCRSRLRPCPAIDLFAVAPARGFASSLTFGKIGRAGVSGRVAGECLDRYVLVPGAGHRENSQLLSLT